MSEEKAVTGAWSVARSAPQLAEDAAEAVRGLNHVTIRAEGYAQPADVDAVLGSLAVMAQRLPQALDQAVRWLSAEHVAGRVGHDTPGIDPVSAVEECLRALEESGTWAVWLGEALVAARNQSAHLTGLGEGQ